MIVSPVTLLQMLYVISLFVNVSYRRHHYTRPQYHVQRFIAYLSSVSLSAVSMRFYWVFWRAVNSQVGGNTTSGNGGRWFSGDQDDDAGPRDLGTSGPHNVLDLRQYLSNLPKLLNMEYSRSQHAQSERAKKPRRHTRLMSPRASLAIAKFQTALLKVVDCLVEDETKEGPILRGAKPSEIAACASAWDKLEDRRGVLEGKGKPKPVTATNDPGRVEPAKAVAAAAEEAPDLPVVKFG